MWYLVSTGMWKRVLVLIGLWIVVTRLAKHKYLRKGQEDTYFLIFSLTVCIVMMPVSEILQLICDKTLLYTFI